MENSIFRKKSIDRISSPESLTEYLRVTTPSAYIILIAAAVALLGLFIWSNAMSINSFAYGDGVVVNGIMTVTFRDSDSARNVDNSMRIVVGDNQMSIDTVGVDEHGRTIAVCKTNMPNGNYEAKVCYRQTQIISMLFN
mgnify:CR=1 FL=1